MRSFPAFFQTLPLPHQKPTDIEGSLIVAGPARCYAFAAHAASGESDHVLRALVRGFSGPWQFTRD